MSTSPLTLDGWRRAVRTLEALGVTHAFGLPGTQSLPLFEALRTSPLTTIVPTSELTAAFAAGAFYRASGRPAALLTIPGPGFAFALPGIAEARADSAALLHLTMAAAEGPDAAFRLQAIPQSVLGAALAKATFEVSALADVEPTLRAAHAAATGGEPGPVIVTFREPGSANARWEPTAGTAAPASSAPACTIDEGWQRLLAARRPLVLAGQGAIACAADIVALVEALGAPLLTTPGARGLLREDHPLVVPFDPYRGGHEQVRALVARADLVLVLGAKLGHNGTAGHGLGLVASRLLQVDADARIAGAAYGNAAVVARTDEWFAGKPSVRLARCDWTEAELLACHAAIRAAAHGAEPLVAGHSPAAFFRALRATLPAEAMLVTDTGQHQMLARRHYDVLSPRGLLTPSDFQSMGFGLPAAIAARLAAPTRPVAAVVGDGSLAITGLELATASALRLTLPVLVFVDGYLNQIRMHQGAEYGFDSGVRLAPIDLSALAAATGAAYAEVGDLAEAMHAALRREGPTLIAVPVADSLAVQGVRVVRRAKDGVRSLVSARALAALRGRR